MYSARPLTTAPVPSVAMNGATLRVATVKPLTAPITRDTPIAADRPSTNRPSEPSITIQPAPAEQRLQAGPVRVVGEHIRVQIHADEPRLFGDDRPRVRDADDR